MRIRSTKPEFWRSERIASVSWDARLILKGLESFVDDNGVGRDDIALIVGDVFPRDMLASPRETVARVSEGISELHRAGLLWRYEANSTRLLYVSFWESIQRIDKPGVGRFPRPDGTMNYRDSEIRESVASPRETVAPGTGEQGNRGTGEREQGKEVARATIAAVPVPATASGVVVQIKGDKVRVATETREVVHAAVPTTVLRSQPVRDGLYGHAQRLANEGATPGELQATLAEWCRRTDVMPGHLPHIYSELARKAAGATSTESQRRQQSKARDWATLAAEVEAEEMRALP